MGEEVTAIADPRDRTVEAIYALHAQRAADEEARGYLGWSQLGEPCARALWYSFRWAERETIEGRIARLFDTGHREEARVLAELRAIGLEVWDRDADGQQFGVASVGGHLRGHADAVVRGLAEAPKTPHLVDVKSIKAKKFDELLKKGMRDLFPKYWAQAMGYMGHLQLERAAFIFSCKDDDRLHIERVEFDRREFDALEAKARRIITAEAPPPRLSDDPAWFECRFCAYRDICHGETAPRVNCRTCAHSTPILEGDGAWVCARDGAHIAWATQRTGCSSHTYIPPLLEHIGRPAGFEDGGVVYERDGETFVNGPRPGFSSIEIRACRDKRALVDPEIRAERERLGATITG